jgi:putative transposase
MDESGLLMAPLVRRSWAPKGQPAVLTPKAQHREKVSVAAALWLTPQRNRLGLGYQTRVNGYFTNTHVATFLEDCLGGWQRRLVVVWDGGTMHKGDPLDTLVEEADGRLDLELLPPYAPELMPVEQLWAWLKYDRLCNFAPDNAQQLDEAIRRELDTIRDDQQRLQNFFHASDLPLPRALLS